MGKNCLLLRFFANKDRYLLFTVNLTGLDDQHRQILFGAADGKPRKTKLFYCNFKAETKIETEGWPPQSEMPNPWFGDCGHAIVSLYVTMGAKIKKILRSEQKISVHAAKKQGISLA